MNIYAQFSDASETAIIAVFGAPQDPKVYANLATLGTSDSRYTTYYSELPAWAQAGLPAPMS
jgi:hypothetical protein